MIKLIIFTLVLLSQSILAIDSSICDDKNLEKLPTQEGGRVKPIYVLAKDSINFIFQKKPKIESTKLFCLLSFNKGQEYLSSLSIKAEHEKLWKMFSTDKGSGIPIEKALTSMSDLRIEYQQNKEDSSYQKEVNKVLFRIDQFQKITNGSIWTVWSSNQWQAINLLNSISNEEFRSSFDSLDPSIKSTSSLEYYFTKLAPFTWSILITLLSLILVFGMKSPTPALILAGISVIIQTLGMFARVYISGRAPITNMYETVMFSGLGALILCLGIYSYKKNKAFLYTGLFYNILCLFMMKFANNMLDESIKPLVPVLRDNFWLSTHVTTIILSYAALALSWVMANIALIGNRFFNLDSKSFSEYNQLIYTSMKYGIILLSAGVILGGIWADYSWGRFWGWDPKETWSLIVLLIYMAILHGRYSSWISKKVFPLVSSLAFLSVMMAWFGVNYILASGLHSYGFSEGGAIFLGSFFAIQIFISLVCSIPKMKKAS